MVCKKTTNLCVFHMVKIRVDCLDEMHTLTCNSWYMKYIQIYHGYTNLFYNLLYSVMYELCSTMKSKCAKITIDIICHFFMGTTKMHTVANPITPQVWNLTVA